MSGSSVRAIGPLVGLEQRDPRPPPVERLGHLQPDVARADHRDVAAPEAAGLLQQVDPVVDGLHAADPGRVDAGEVGADRVGAGAEDQLVEAEPVGAVAVEVADLDGAGVEVDADRLLPHAHVDALLPAEHVGRAGDEVVGVGHVAGHEVGDAAGRVARAGAALEGHDVEVGPQPSGLRRRRHPRGVPSDDDEAVRHGRRLPTAPSSG